MFLHKWASQRHSSEGLNSVFVIKLKFIIKASSCLHPTAGGEPFSSLYVQVLANFWSCVCVCESVGVCVWYPCFCGAFCLMQSSFQVVRPQTNK